MSRRVRSHIGILNLAFGVSSLALACGQAHAQTAPQATDPNTAVQSGANADAAPQAAADPTQDASAQQGAISPDVIVTGIRSSLANSQNLKKNADTVVDAITAEDIGALPDRSVTEALQRVPGVSITRFAGVTDPDHFSVEGSGFVIRGLTYVRSEFNGRDSFSVNGGRALNFQDVSPELLGSVEVFKNQTADMIEGGISGTVDLDTRKPFDSSKPVLYISADMNYSDYIKKGSPSISALYSRNFDTGIGRFGVLVGASYSQLYSRSDGLQVTNFQARNIGTDVIAGAPAGQTVYAPVGAGIRTEDHDRKRFGASAALQYESLDKSVLATLQFVRTDARETWGEHTIETNPDSIDYATFPAAGTDYTFDSNNVFSSGIISYDRGYDPGANYSRYGMLTQLANRGVKTRSVTDDYGANVKWQATDRLSFNFDGQYIRSTSKQTDMSVYGSTFANVDLDLTGKYPDITFLPPDGSDPATYYADPSHSYYRAAMDHFEDNDGHEWNARADGTYDLGDGFFKKVKFGARYADRDQTVRYSLYNWGALSEVWAGNGAVTFDQASALGVPDANHFFDDMFRGSGPSGYSAPYLSGNPAEEYADVVKWGEAIESAWGSTGWIPAGERAGVIPGTPFLPSEVYENRERTAAGYFRVDFGSEGGMIGNLRFSGNFGLRYVHTLDTANGFFTFPTQSQIIGNVDQATYCAATPTPVFCQLTPQQQADVLAFSNGAAINQTTRNSYDHWLPSFNLKMELSPKLIARFAYSKAISRPDFSQLQSTTSIAPSNGTDVFRLEGGSRNSNAYLKPVEANQFDVTAEWYFARVGSLTADVFYKDLKNVIIQNVSQTRSVTNNGVTEDVLFVAPENASGHGHVEGAEIAYQQTFTFLPGPLAGLGLQANYTYVHQSGIPQGGNADVVAATTTINTAGLPLQGLSKHTVNAELFYERGNISARVAYNWRSAYLLTIRDEIVPNLPIMAAASGQMDASLIYTVNDSFKIGIQAVNLLDSVTKTMSVINSDELEAPRSYFKSDRRFSLTTRIKF